MRKYRTSDKVMSRALARKEARLQRDISRPKHRYLKPGKVSIHIDRAIVSTCTEGKYHNPYFIPMRIRVMNFSGFGKLLYSFDLGFRGFKEGHKIPINGRQKNV